MIAGRLRPFKTAKIGPGPREHKPGRTKRFLVLTLGAGVLSGVAALAGIPPFGSVQALLAPISQFLHPRQAPEPILASSVFPSVPPIHKTVDVYDPAPPAKRSNPAPAPPRASPTPHEHPSPTPPLQSSPSPSPKGGD